jgi:hypothetical protein
MPTNSAADIGIGIAASAIAFWPKLLSAVFLGGFTSESRDGTGRALTTLLPKRHCLHQASKRSDCV